MHCSGVRDMGSGTRRIAAVETESALDPVEALSQPTTFHDELYSDKEFALAINAGRGRPVTPVDHGHGRPIPVPDHGHHGQPVPVPDHGHHGAPIPVPDHGHHIPPVVDRGHQPGHIPDVNHNHNNGRPFNSGHHWGPPVGSQWGWHDQARFNRGWNVWFFQQSPNYELWRQEIAQEARNIGILLDTGNGQLAARQLQADLIRLRPDRYAQNELLFQVNQLDRKGVGSDLVLGQWDPRIGGWDQGYIVQSRFSNGPVYPVWY